VRSDATKPAAAPTIFTVGHGARSIDTFIALLHEADIESLVDVRTAPGSRKHPHFGKDALHAALEPAGIAYRWQRELGGFRRSRPDSRHVALRSAGFRGYADHMETIGFKDALEGLIDVARERRTTVMCAESVWWRCHRRMLADALVATGCDVVHLMDGGRRDRHRLSAEARRVDGDLVYDLAEGGQQRLDAG
jgi:uncharacterized protein (DUF488 family)